MILADLERCGFVVWSQQVRESKPTLFFCLQAFLLLVVLFAGTFPYTYPDLTTYGYYLSYFYMGPIHLAGESWLAFDWLPTPFLWMAFAAFLLIGSVLTVTEFQTALSHRWLQFLGRISFGIYLLHYVVMQLTDILIMPYLGPAINAPGHHDRTGAAIFCFVFIIVPVTLFVSHLFTLWVEETSILMARDFTLWWSRHFPVWCRSLRKGGTDGAIQPGPPPTDEDAMILQHPQLADAQESVQDKGAPATIELIHVGQPPASNNDDTPHDTSNNYQPIVLPGEASLITGDDNKAGKWSWTSKRMILMYVLAFWFIPCCVPPPSGSGNCTIHDDFYVFELTD
jgi:hypothetical protein